MIVRSLKIYVTLIFSMFTMLCVADGISDLIHIDFADSVNHTCLGIDDEGDTVYVFLMKSTSEFEIIDSLCLDKSSEDIERPKGNGYGYEKLGELNDTTELVRLRSDFSVSVPNIVSWNRCKTFSIMVTPHKMQLIEKHDYYTENWSNADPDDPKNEKWEVVYENYSCSISDRITNGFYEIDVKKVTEEGDNDDNRHVTSSSSWVLYYDGEKFVRREGETVE